MVRIAACAVVVDDLEQRRDLLGQPRPDGRLGVVGALDELGAVEVAQAGDASAGSRRGCRRGRWRCRSAGWPCGGRGPRAGPRCSRRDRHGGRASAEGVVERLGLDARPREAVEDRAVGARRRPEAVEEHAHDRVVGHELAAAHVAVGLAARAASVRATAARNRSPVARTGMPSRAARIGACVPFPAPGAPSRTMTVMGVAGRSPWRRAEPVRRERNAADRPP